MSGPADYNSIDVPEGYVCDYCGANGVKLWRQYQTFFPKLYCVVCACKRGIPESRGDPPQLQPEDIGLDGGHPYRYAAGGRTYQLNNLVPAIPDEDSGAYWGHGAENRPVTAWSWWQRLPNQPNISNIILKVSR